MIQVDTTEAVYLTHKERIAVYRIFDEEFSMILSEHQYRAYRDGGILQTVFNLQKERAREERDNQDSRSQVQGVQGVSDSSEGTDAECVHYGVIHPQRLLRLPSDDVP